ncbi:MAG: haloacid dehalogenase-like hydrolase [Actinobacteria bacterium]|nr:haloacid dehalogenase-like hydrolase [Actinomycetota bacterium]
MSVDSGRRLVLWDVDGTLVSNDESDERLFVAATESVLGPLPEIVHPYRHGKTDRQQVTEYLEVNGGSAAQADQGSSHLIDHSEAHFAEPGERISLPGVRAILEALTAAGHVNALLTGNSDVRAGLKLRSAGLSAEHFDWSASFFGGSADSRIDLTRAASDYAAEHDLVPVVIGDTAADSHAAEMAGIDFIGVATGVYSAADLRATPNILVVDDLETGRQSLLALLSPSQG